MKKLITLFLIFFTLISFVFGKPVDPSVAKTAGRNFLLSSDPGAKFDLELVYTSASKKGGITFDNPVNYFFIFNINKDRGFIIVSADDIVKPVLGYSRNLGFEPENIPPHVASWLDWYGKQINLAIDNGITATPEIKNEWADLLKGSLPNGKLEKKAGSLDPMIQTTWNQTFYYNDLCPYDVSQGARTITGCVATAMAQVMKYWNYPSKGKGAHTYYLNGFGNISANFGVTSYRWSNMPNSLMDTNTAVATLMSHCGISIDMEYGVALSGAYPFKIPYAFKSYFGYHNSVQYIEREDYTESQWITLLKKELDAGRPVIYSGSSSSGNGGHCFIADGYDTKGYFHFNWGWGGYSDGYFSVNSLFPSKSDYSYYQDMIIGVEPIHTMEMYSEMKTNRTSLVKGSGVSASLKVINRGDSTFYGKYRLCLLKQDLTLAEVIDSVNGINGLLRNSYDSLTFKKSKILSSKGTYLLTLQLKAKNSNEWVLVEQRKFLNLVKINVNDSVYVNPPDIYEENNDFDHSYSLTTNYLNNKAKVTTLGSNCHSLDDYDYYKINLPKGYNYTLAARLQDKKSNNNGEIYTLDCLFSYSAGGSSWSDGYEDTLPGKIKLNNGGVIWFLVTSGINGGTGTYLLDIDISRISTRSASKNITGFVVPNTVGTVAIDTLAATVDLYVSKSTQRNSLSPVISISNLASIDPASGMPRDFTNPVQYTVWAQDSTNRIWTVTIKNEPGSIPKECIQSDLVKIYPNPAINLVEITMNDLHLISEQLNIIDLNGKMMLNSVDKLGNGNYQLDISNFDNGIYIMKLPTDKGTITKKLVILK